MALDFNQRSYTKSVDQAAIDEGLRAYMLKVYNYMTIGLLLTGFIAYFFGKASIVTNETGQIVGVTQVGALLFGSPLKWIVMLAPLGFVFYLSARINRMSVSAAQITFWLFASIMGLSLASVFIEFTQTSIARVFFITAGTFGAMSLYGYTTKRDLTKLGGFLFMGLIGIIIASVVNIFVGSTALQFAISVIGGRWFADLVRVSCGSGIHPCVLWPAQPRILHAYQQRDISGVASGGVMGHPSTHRLRGGHRRENFCRATIF